jgi:predicted DNA-binding antitoxin AbrB/MazE fold protein
MMADTITAIYENGVLRPLGPLSLQDGETVELQVSPANPKILAEFAVQSLVEKGVLTPPPNDPKIKSVTQEEVCKLATKLGAKPGKSLSEIIIEDRG